MRRKASTFDAIAGRFFASPRFKAQRQGFVVERIVRKELLPTLGQKPAAEITHRDIRDIIEAVVARPAPRYAHNVLDAAAAVFEFAVDREDVDANPCRLLRRKSLIGAKRIRQHVLDDAELRVLWQATERLGYPYCPLFRLLLLTGVRLNEAAGSRWGEFDLTGKIWRIPAERFKSDAEHIVPLSDDVVALLRELPQFTTDYLFSGPSGGRINSFNKAKARLDKEMLAILREANPAAGLEPFVVHDLRRTCRTRLSALKIQDHVAEMVIGHARKGLQRVYDQHKFIDEMREALQKWSIALRIIVNPPTPTDEVVVAFRATA
jgi:integrase